MVWLVYLYLDMDKCSGCGICEKLYPGGQGEETSYEILFYLVEECPFYALKLTHEIL